MSSSSITPSKFIKTMIVDDDEACRSRLRRLLKSYGTVLLVEGADNGLDALEKIRKTSPALVFMDIEMPKLSGIEVARSLGVNKPMIVFVSTYDEYAIKAFELSATDYLLKPVLPKRLALTMEKVFKMLSHGGPYPYEDYLSSEQSFHRNTRISFTIGKEIAVLNMSDIMAITTESRYSKIHYKNKTLLIDDSLSSLILRLDRRYFIFASRSAIVNIDFVEGLRRLGLRKYVLHMKTPLAEELLVSRGQLALVKQALKKV